MISNIFKFLLQGFYQPFQQLLFGHLEAGLFRTFQEEFQYYQVVTQADVLAVSDGTGMLTAHLCTTHNFITCQLKLLAATLQKV